MAQHNQATKFDDVTNPLESASFRFKNGVEAKLQLYLF